MSGKVREYEVCLNCGRVVRPDDEGCCDCGLTGEAAERAFAIDRRDIEPLVEALEKIAHSQLTHESAALYAGELKDCARKALGQYQAGGGER